MSLEELKDKVEGEVEHFVDEHLGNNNILKEVAAPYEAELVKAGEAVISHALLNEIEQRRSQEDLNTLIPACQKLLELVDKYVPVEKVESFVESEVKKADEANAKKAEESGQSVVAAPAEPDASVAASEPAPSEEQAAPASDPAPEAPAEPAPAA